MKELRINIKRTTLITWITLFLLNFMGEVRGFSQSFYGKNIKEIRIKGAHRTKKYIILRQLSSKVGEPCLEQNLKEDENKLKKLGIFSQVDVFAMEDKGKTVVVVEVKEYSLYLPAIKVQISDENGLSVGGGMKSLNFSGRGIYFSGSLTIGGATTISLVMENPWFSDKHLSYRVEFYQRDRRNKVDDYNEIASELFLSISKKIGKNIQAGTRFSFQSIGSDTVGKTLSENNRDNVPAVGLFLGFDSRDSATDPHYGWHNELEISKVGVFGGDSDFWRGNLDLQFYLPITHRNTLALFSLTTYTGGTVGKEIAPWQDFSIGGTNSVRGWSLGTHQGKNQFINTVEFRSNVIRPKKYKVLGLTLPLGLQLAIFGDMGTVWNEPNGFRKNFIVGFGFGIRILVPTVGMTRFDIGFGEGGFQVKLHLGSFEKAVRQRLRVR